MCFLVSDSSRCLLGYGLATSIYLKKAASEPILGPEEVEKAALEAAMSFYDNASNCNRTRGGMKKASDTSVLPPTHLLTDADFDLVLMPSFQANSHNLSHCNGPRNYSPPLIGCPSIR